MFSLLQMYERNQKKFLQKSCLKNNIITEVVKFVTVGNKSMKILTLSIIFEKYIRELDNFLPWLQIYIMNVKHSSWRHQFHVRIISVSQIIFLRIWMKSFSDLFFGSFKIILSVFYIICYTWWFKTFEIINASTCCSNIF